MNAALAPAAVVVRRTIAASAEDLFDAWLDPQALAQWMRPGTIQSTVAHVEPRVGGRYEITMQAASGPILHQGVYRTIDRPRRLVFTLSERNLSRSQSRVNVEIVPAGIGCELTLVHENVPPDQASRIEGRWAGMLYGLEILIGR